MTGNGGGWVIETLTEVMQPLLSVTVRVAMAAYARLVNCAPEKVAEGPRLPT